MFLQGNPPASIIWQLNPLSGGMDGFVGVVPVAAAAAVVFVVEVVVVVVLKVVAVVFVCGGGVGGRVGCSRRGARIINPVLQSAGRPEID